MQTRLKLLSQRLANLYVEDTIILYKVENVDIFSENVDNVVITFFIRKDAFMAKCYVSVNLIHS